MSLRFTASTNLVNFGSGASLDGLDNGGTWLGWYYPTALAGDRTYFYKTNSSYVGMGFKPPGANTAGLRFDQSRATTDLRIQTLDTVVTLNAWNFVAAVWDPSATDADQFLYVGSLSALATEVSTYSHRTVGSGSVSSTASDSLSIGNVVANAQAFLGWVGDVAWVGAWNTQLSLGQIRALQFRPVATSGCVLSCWLGFNGTSTQPDWSGNGNAGSVTGATAPGTNVPLPRPNQFYAGLRGDPGVSLHPTTAPHVPLRGRVAARGPSFSANAASSGGATLATSFGIGSGFGL